MPHLFEHGDVVYIYVSACVDAVRIRGTYSWKQTHKWDNITFVRIVYNVEYMFV